MNKYFFLFICLICIAFFSASCRAAILHGQTRTIFQEPKVITETQILTAINSTATTSSSSLAGSDVSQVLLITPTPSKTPKPFETVAPSTTPTLVPPPVYSPTPDVRPDPVNWRFWPVVPTVSVRAVEIYQAGLANGTDPQTFSIIGDCQSEPPVFMGIYATQRYILRPSELYLEDTIAKFLDDFNRQHVTVRNGASVASMFSPLWATGDTCLNNETPLACEFRLRHPSIVFINLGTNWDTGDGPSHRNYLRQIIEFSIDQGALPILSTKGDNQEGDFIINLTTAELAYEYDIPLWNFWSAIQYLPNHGLDFTRQNQNYLTVAAWNERSYTGLKVLDRVWRSVNGMPLP